VSGNVEAFVGAEPPPPHLAIDAERLKAWIAGRLPGFEGEIGIAKFKGGQSNPTYRIDTAKGAYVLRRKPPGKLVATAHAIDREFRVLSALSDSGVPIPRAHLYCQDEGVIGSQFYIVDAVAGDVPWRADLPDKSPDYRRAFYGDLMGVLAKIHAVDFQAVGLSDFGKTAGYTSRNLERWYGIYRNGVEAEIPVMEAVAAELRARMPADEPISLVHGDYGCHNVIAAPQAPRVAAVLDWEMATLGNPLIDLAHTLRPWLEPYDEKALRPSLLGRDLKALGIPTLEEAIAIYEAAGGPAWRDGDFYLAFAMFRYACMVQSVLKRAADGTAANKVIPHTPAKVVALAETARGLLEGAR